MISVGRQVFLFYDARPFMPNVKAYKCEIVKTTKTGFKIKNLDSPGLYEDVIFYGNGTARGWNTLTLESAYDKQAIEDYRILRERMEREAPPTGEKGEKG